MAMQTEAADIPETTPASERRARARELTPDDEALLLMAKLLERTAVAKSFAKIATGFVLGSAAVAAKQLKTAAGLDARLERVKKIARAATDAAVHVATHREPAAPPQEEAPPAAPEAT